MRTWLAIPFVFAPLAACVALPFLLFSSSDVAKITNSVNVFFGVIVFAIITGVLRACFPGRSETDVSGEITTALWAIYYTLGPDAEREVADLVSYQPYASKNDGTRKYRPGCNIATLQEAADEIAKKHKKFVPDLRTIKADEIKNLL